MRFSKGYSKPVFLVAAVVLALLFVLVFWSSAGNLMDKGFQTAFGLAEGYP